MKEGQLIESQVAYYRARAGEYDQWFLRQGRYDRGPEHRSKWRQELAIVETALREEVREVVLSLPFLLGFTSAKRFVIAGDHAGAQATGMDF